jgi:hypothetical protein
LVPLSPVVAAAAAYDYLDQSLAVLTGQDTLFLYAICAPYLPEAKMAPLILRLLDEAHSRARGELLSLLGAMEGEWPEAFRIKPALSAKTGPRSCLATLGGPGAALEVYDAITDALRWWP